MQQQKQAENLEEKVVIVDEDNNVIGSEVRKIMRDKVLGHRSTFIFLINSNGQICTHLRHQDKKWCGGYWTTVFGGCVADNEDYLSNAIKEIEEEAGIQNAKLEDFGFIKYWTDIQKEWGKLFWIHYDGEVIFQKEEIQKIQWRNLAEIAAIKEQFTPDGNEAVDLLIKYAETRKNEFQFFEKLLQK